MAHAATSLMRAASLPSRASLAGCSRTPAASRVTSQRASVVVRAGRRLSRPRPWVTEITARAAADDSSTASDDDALKSEAAGGAKRSEESKKAGVVERRPPRGGDPPPAEGGWEWTLNWDPIAYDEDGAIADPNEGDLKAAGIIVGSCPRTPEDVDRLIDEAGVEAIVCLQCSLCHGALKIDWDPIRARALERGVPIVRVAVRDFDRLDQAKMLPEMVRKLACFRAMGKRTYVHCTAGINRASLCALGYLTFVQGMEYEHALRIIKENRPQANPYAVSWNIARERLLAGRLEDVYLYTQVDMGGNSVEDGGDWIKRDLDAANIGVIKSIFERAVEADLSLVAALEDMQK